MGILDERFTGLQFPCAHIKHAEIEENERLTSEWLKKQGLKEVPVVAGFQEKQITQPIYNTVPSEKNNGKEAKKIRQTTSSTGYMNLYERCNGLYVVYVGAVKLCEPIALKDAIELRDKHRAKIGMPPAKDKIK